jgi:L-asparaginase/Glu-tRNA(Gln) amidotransferase subunit D
LPSNDSLPERRPLKVHVLGGTIACEEHDAPKCATSGKGTAKVLLPESGKIRRIIENEVSDSVKGRVHFRSHRDYSESDPVIDSSDLNVQILMETVDHVREMTKEKANIILVSGTDNAAYLMQALAEGVNPKTLGDNNIIVVVSQTHAPHIPADAKEPVCPPETEAVDNMTNAIYLSTRAEMAGRIGLYCGGKRGVLLGPRGLVKTDTESKQPYRGRYRVIAKADDSHIPNWQFATKKPEDSPRGRPHKYRLASGIENWGFGPTSDYGNLPAAMGGMMAMRKGSGVSNPVRNLINKLWGVSKRRSDFNAMVVQAPGSGNLRQNEEELACVNEAAEIGLAGGVPVVLISDPLQPHWAQGNFMYGGDFELMREQMDTAAGGEGQSPVLSGGKLSLSEAQLIASQSTYRGRNKHRHKGRDLVDYVSKSFTDYEGFLRGEEA